jgi:hypothetical protein
MMRILTVRQPWAWAIIRGGKDVENRTRNFVGSYRGPVAINAGKHLEAAEVNAALASFPKPDDQTKARLEFMGDPIYVSAIVGVVDLVDVHVGARFTDRFCYRAPAIGAPMVIPEPRCSAWAQTDTYHLVLENPRALAAPIPHKGALGLRTVDAELEARIWAEVQQ